MLFITIVIGVILGIWTVWPESTQPKPVIVNTSQSHQLIADSVFENDVVVKGFSLVKNCVIRGDLVAEDEIPMFVGCDVYGEIIHPGGRIIACRERKLKKVS